MTGPPDQPSPGSASPGAPPAASTRRRRWVLGAAALVVAVVAAVVVARSWPRPAPPPMRQHAQSEWKLRAN